MIHTAAIPLSLLKPPAWPPAGGDNHHDDSDVPSVTGESPGTRPTEAAGRTLKTLYMICKDRCGTVTSPFDLAIRAPPALTGPGRTVTGPRYSSHWEGVSRRLRVSATALRAAEAAQAAAQAPPDSESRVRVSHSLRLTRRLCPEWPGRGFKPSPSQS